ncbi:hypothetical protein fugu_001218 [Takifugu bimaculatus]|uniref:Myosin tail domain-containing protein n=1 Tax=Takifugu bimaculatus TaxID=433685 RepID=A0A4Z2CIX2_9TELE|nr:hypothetical protein fugu_001218 [Takifugu bimaculatus]
MKCAAVVGLQVSSESQVKKLEEQLSESSRRGDDLQRVLTELSVAKNRLTADNADMARQMEEAESRGSQLSRSKTLLQSQLEELKKSLEEEVKCISLSLDFVRKSHQKALESLQASLDVEELQAQLEEEVRSHEEHREELAAMERRCVLLVSEGEETHAALESAERDTQGHGN